MTDPVRAPNLPLAIGVPDYVLVQDSLGNSPTRYLIALLSALIESNQGPVYDTRATLFADLNWAANTVGYVYGDATEAFRGVYKKSGASGAGAWTRIGPLPGADLSGVYDVLTAIEADLALKGNIHGQAFVNPTVNTPALGDDSGAIPNTAWVHNAYATLAHLDQYQLLSAKGQINGYLGLDSGAKVPLANLPSYPIVGGTLYKGLWNATTNSPAIPTAAGGNTGWFYEVSVAGTTSISGIAVWAVGDYIVSNGTAWEKLQGAPASDADSITIGGQKHIMRRVIGDSACPVVFGDNNALATANSAAIHAAFAASPGVWELPRNVDLTVDNILIPRSNNLPPCGIEGDWTQRLIASEDFFTNTHIAGGIDAEGAMFRLFGETSGGFDPSIGHKLCGFTIDLYRLPDGVFVNGMTIRNAERLLIDLRVQNGRAGWGIQHRGLRDSDIAIDVRDFTTAVDTYLGGVVVSGGISIEGIPGGGDNNPDADLRILAIVEDITYTDDALATYNRQTTGVSNTGLLNSGIKVLPSSRIRGVDQGIDNYGIGFQIEGADIDDCRVMAVSFKHSPLGSSVKNCNLRGWGVYGFYISAGSASRDSVDCLIEGCVINDGDPDDVNGATTRACIYVEPDAGGEKVDRFAARNNRLNPGNADWCEFSATSGAVDLDNWCNAAAAAKTFFSNSVVSRSEIGHRRVKTYTPAITFATTDPTGATITTTGRYIDDGSGIVELWALVTITNKGSGGAGNLRLSLPSGITAKSVAVSEIGLVSSQNYTVAATTHSLQFVPIASAAYGWLLQERDNNGWLAIDWAALAAGDEFNIHCRFEKVDYGAV